MRRQKALLHAGRLQKTALSNVKTEKVTLEVQAYIATTSRDNRTSSLRLKQADLRTKQNESLRKFSRLY